MSADIDAMLLDQVFQPAGDRLEGWTTCFGLARLCLGAAVALQTGVLALEIGAGRDPAMLGLTAGLTVLAYFGADHARALIARVERQSRPGAMNLRRVTLRWQRLTWLGAAACCTGSSLASLEGGAICAGLASLAWVASVYFLSCSPTPPASRTFRRYAAALA